MAEAVYSLCGLTSLACAFLLFRQYGRTPGSLLFWSTLSFVCFAVTNVILFVDLVVLPTVDLSLVRSIITMAGMAMLLLGLVRQST